MGCSYYNENDPYAAQWLRNLIAANLLPAGDVDERSIVDVRADDVRVYKQCHFFAGIGGWGLALRLASWPDDKAVWTGSCPCQPFSAAGKRKGFADDRHLWPVWFGLIRERRPSIIFGEQVEAAVRQGWLDAVFADLEGQGYACGAAVLPACGVGAPHIRQRVWFVADADRDERGSWRGREALEGRAEPQRPPEQSAGLRDDGGVAHLNGRHPGTEGLQRSGQHGLVAQDGRSVRVADTEHGGCEGWESDRRVSGSTLPSSSDGELGNAARHEQSGPWLTEAGERRTGEAGRSSPWSDCDWLPCTDGKARPVEPGTFPLAHGIPGRVGRLRAYGNAIVPQVAAEFIRAMP